MKSVRAWLGLDRLETPETTPLRSVIDALDHLEPARAQYLARFAYLLGRVAHADRHVTAEETRAMETLVKEEGGLDTEQAMLVVSLAKSTNLLFGATADFQIAQEFAESTTYDQKLALARCLFSVASTDEAISMSEETEIHRITKHLKIEPKDVTALRLQHRTYLPGLSAGRKEA
jgi:uncharacterized tellurite resistance protein B-like protein